jgi:hypothetical protein
LLGAVKRVQHIVLSVEDIVDTSVADMLASEEPQHMPVDLFADTHVVEGTVF